MAKITHSNEDYLEAMLLLEHDGKVRSVDVASLLGVSKPAVSVACTDLIAKGLITKESYGDILLTDEGRRIASSTLSKHHLIKKVLLAIGVEEKTAEEECCKIEHILSDETLGCIAKMYTKIQSNND